MKRLVLSLGITAMTLYGCATFCPKFVDSSEPAKKTADARNLTNAGRYSEALAVYRQILHDYPDTQWAGTAKYSIATLYTAGDNPQKDYLQALMEFDDFLLQYPNHERVADAKSWRSTLKLLLDTRKDNERLSKSIEKLKQLDVKQEERRSGR